MLKLHEEISELRLGALKHPMFKLNYREIVRKKYDVERSNLKTVDPIIKANSGQTQERLLERKSRASSTVSILPSRVSPWAAIIRSWANSSLTSIKA